LAAQPAQLAIVVSRTCLPGAMYRLTIAYFTTPRAPRGYGIVRIDERRALLCSARGTAKDGMAWLLEVDSAGDAQPKHSAGECQDRKVAHHKPQHRQPAVRPASCERDMTQDRGQQREWPPKLIKHCIE
jgi:hypothetical protein